MRTRCCLDLQAIGKTFSHDHGAEQEMRRTGFSAGVCTILGKALLLVKSRAPFLIFFSSLVDSGSDGLQGNHFWFNCLYPMSSIAMRIRHLSKHRPTGDHGSRLVSEFSGKALMDLHVNLIRPYWCYYPEAFHGHLVWFLPHLLNGLQLLTFPMQGVFLRAASQCPHVCHFQTDLFHQKGDLR